MKEDERTRPVQKYIYVNKYMSHDTFKTQRRQGNHTRNYVLKKKKKIRKSLRKKLKKTKEKKLR